MMIAVVCSSLFNTVFDIDNNGKHLLNVDCASGFVFSNLGLGTIEHDPLS